MVICRTPYWKIAALRVMYFNGPFDKVQAGKDLNISYTTVIRYVRVFTKIRDAYPERISDKKFFSGIEKLEHRPTELYVELLTVIPELLLRMTGLQLHNKLLYPIYKALCPDGYGIRLFRENFFKWCALNDVSRQRFYRFPEEDLAVLAEWRKGNDVRLWKIVVAFLDSVDRKPILKVAEKIETTRETIYGWLKIYRKSGLKGFDKTQRKTNPLKTDQIKIREDNLIHILHQLPKIYGINRTSWKQEDLAAIYYQQHGEKISRVMIGRDLRKRGYRMSRSRPD